MFDVAETHRVEVTFIGTPPSRQVARASGVSGVEVDGRTLRCVVRGSFQPFLDALRGYEVVSFTACPEPEADGTPSQPVGGSTEVGP